MDISACNAVRLDSLTGDPSSFEVMLFVAATGPSVAFFQFLSVSFSFFQFLSVSGLSPEAVPFLAVKHWRLSVYRLCLAPQKPPRPDRFGSKVTGT